MFCSNCGFENPADHRFCGMCGTPLPQRPITAPGAQSTIGFTRHPVEVSQGEGSTTSSVSTLTSEVAPTGPNYFSQAEQAESLDQFIAGFRYTPPSEEDEVTMTGAKPELDTAGNYQPATPVSLSEEPQATTAESLHIPAVATDIEPAVESVEQPPLVVTEPPPFATKGMKEDTAERSRFLDFSEPAKEAPPMAPPSIGGPSFLGLSDTPASPAYVGDDVAGGQSHWRAWTALIVICVFAGLAFLEWRAEKNQSSNGPIGIMKMQIDRLKGRKGAVITPPASSEATTEPAEPNATTQPAGSGPQMQVAPQQKPQTAKPQPANSTPAATEKPANPGAASNAPTTPAKGAQPASSNAEKAPAIAQKPQTATTKAQPATDADAETANNSTSHGDESVESNAEKPTKGAAPGAEELAKAGSASDAEAASAWLWKAVAKGNPEAPIKLANMYIKGDGVPQNCDQALVLLRSAAAKDNAPARSRLGSLYATGTCVPRNRVRAYQYMSQALEANPNAVWPRQFREQLWAHMTPQERQQAQASQ